ncbi:MAG: hypothetical protein LQ350_001692 [Teloschistes chrysophthalmus]|nr:MAG: hypothetical protein LQ350_001692 [Niorma chrysophthalma]
MADEKKNTGSSLADRLTKADGSKFISPKVDTDDAKEPTPSQDTDGSGSWADEVETPVKADTEPVKSEPEPVKADAEPVTASATHQIEGSLAKAQLDGSGDDPSQDENSLLKAQFDGATDLQQGSPLHGEPSYNVDVKLSDVQADPNNPLYSIKNFNELGLRPEILKGIYDMGFVKPSKIQEKALPLLLANPPVNMIGQSQSGTGKTAAFVLNILIRLDMSTPEARRTPQAMVLAPSRELARQIMGVVQVMGKYLDGLEVAAAIPADKENRGKHLQGQIIVGTPGTAMDLIKKRLISASTIKVLVLDEADNMLDQQGLGDQCIRVKKLLPPKIQVVLFSATFPDYVVQYADMFAPQANQITLKHEELTVEGIKQLYLDCPTPQHKYDSLVRLYGLMTIGSSIIFVKTRATALEVERRMNEEGHQCACLTGEYEGRLRDTIIDAFRSGQAKVLITTNVLSRGIDVQSVSLVVNYDLPDMAPTDHNRADTQTYLHRIGRTGRFGRVGVSISLISGGRDFNIMSEIEQYFGVRMQGLDTSDWDDVEEKIKAVLKSTRAQANYRPTVKGDVDM